MSADLTGDGKTVLKLHYGKFWVYPAPLFTAAFNPNPSGWSQTYLWTNDANGNGRWDAGEEGRLSSVSGGSASTRLDPDIENTYVHQASAYIEREVAPDFGVRTGVVLNARRQPYGTINVSRPLEAYAVPVAVIDPGPDGRLGSADDGATVTAYNLTAESLSAPPVNLTTNLPDSNSEYYTWEITATKRQSGRWSLLASFTETWNHEAALGTGNDFTPNALINSTDCQDRFTTWQAKVNGTMSLPWGFLRRPGLAPPVRNSRSRARLCRRSIMETRRSRRNRSRRTGHPTSRCRPANGEGVPRERCACHGILRRLQHPQHQCRPDADHQLGRLLAAADGDHRAARPPDRRASGMVIAATETHRS